MGFWSRIFRRVEPVKATQPVVHDFTFEFEGHRVSSVKDLDDGRVFLSGSGSMIKQGDSILIRRRDRGPLTVTLRYRVEDIKMFEGQWRAYARLEIRLARPKTPMRLW